MNFEELLKGIEDRKTEIRTILAGEGEADLDALETELRDLDKKKVDLEKRKAILDQATAIQAGTQEARSLGTVAQITKPKEDEVREKNEKMEKRSIALKEGRSIGTTGLVIPTVSSTTINETFNQVSSIVDLIKVTPLMGGDSYEQAYVKTYAEGGITAEGTEYSEGDTQFGYALINKTKITNYTEVNEEVEKLPAADYVTKVEGGVETALKTKIAKQIMVGTGQTGQVTGIFSDQASAILAATDISISGITATTLDEIIYAYGGAENVEGQAWLILNKLDLKAFATLRTNDGKKVYDIKTFGNVGTIDGIPFVINSACKAVTASGTAATSYCMAYGHIQNYELVTFSETDIRKSSDFKFKSGQIAFKGNIMAGGNVVAYNGFIRVKKA